MIGALALAGCGSSTTGGSPGSSPTAGSGGGSTPTSAAATPTPVPPPHALAWFKMDSHNVGQIWASVNGGAPHQITHMSASSADCKYDEHWSPPVFSPDLTKIVAAWGSADCTDGPEHGPIYIINASSGAATLVPSSSIRLSLRETGWLDNSSIWWVNGPHLNKYVVGGGNSVIGTLGGNVEDAVVRGSTLFFVEDVSSGLGFQLARFDLASHSMLGGTINLGTIASCQCSRGDLSSPGFDVSADGSHIVYQTVTPASGSSNEEGVGSSRFFYANADGSGASRIASAATATSMTRMQISPNGHLVAVARAEPAPSVFTASVTSPGGSGDPNLHFYTPDAHSYPVWKTDSSTFWASTKDLSNVYPPATGNFEHFTVGSTSGSVGVAGGANPWYTIGG
ncbi:MAG TPA: hypothetical protein VFN11_18040 [Ktedonobacterales bacterium]|nr:hypothetical protein [Ktedonobacterales bacterium]